MALARRGTEHDDALYRGLGKIRLCGGILPGRWVHLHARGIVRHGAVHRYEGPPDVCQPAASRDGAALGLGVAHLRTLAIAGPPVGAAVRAAAAEHRRANRARGLRAELPADEKLDPFRQLRLR